MKVLSADLIKYNANNRGTRTGDCTARAISLAFNIDYHKARKALNDSAKANWKLGWSYNSINNVKKVIESLGGGRDTLIVSHYTVNDFADSHNKGTYILHCNSNGKEHGPGGHLVTVIDGKIYDSWDSKNQIVLSYHKIDSGIRGEDITDIRDYLKEFFQSYNTETVSEYVNSVFDSIIDKNRKLKKLADDYLVDISLTLDWKQFSFKDYTFKFTYYIVLSIPSYSIYDEHYGSKIGITFTPTMTEDQVKPYFDSKFFTKLYDFTNSIVKKVEDICESNKLLSHPDRELPSVDRYPYPWWDTFSDKSFKALPYWVRRLTKSFVRRNPFEGADYNTIELTIYTPPFDTLYGQSTENSYDVQTRYFHAYNMDDLLKGLQHYKETGNYDESYMIAGDY